MFDRGIGIGNGFLSPTDQSIYAHVYPKLGFVTEEEGDKLKKLDQETLKVSYQKLVSNML